MKSDGADIHPKTYGLMFKPEMIRAYLAGQKTQTRRCRGLDIVNQRPDDWEKIIVTPYGVTFNSKVHVRTKTVFIELPYGSTADTLWFKETYAPLCREATPFCTCENDEERSRNHYVEYRVDTNNPYPGDWPAEEARGSDEVPKWRSSMMMPMRYSRFTNVPIENVRVQRLWSITEADAKAEGWDGSMSHFDLSGLYANALTTNAARRWYFSLWDKINGKKIPLKKNPWVFVYEFPKYQEKQ